MAMPSNPIAALRRPAATLAVFALALLAPVPAAFASVGVGSGAAGPTLRVDAKGNAEVSYKQGGVPRTVLVPVTGAVIYGGKLDRAGRQQGGDQPEAPVREGAAERAERLVLRAADLAGAHRPARAPLLALAGRAHEADVHGDAGAPRHRARGQGHL